MVLGLGHNGTGTSPAMCTLTSPVVFWSHRVPLPRVILTVSLNPGTQREWYSVGLGNNGTGNQWGRGIEGRPVLGLCLPDTGVQCY